MNKLTGKKLDLPDAHTGNYVNLVDGALQLALPERTATRERRYRVKTNLVGNFQFSPMVRLTDDIKSMCGEKFKESSDRLLEKYPPELIYRALEQVINRAIKVIFES